MPAYFFGGNGKKTQPKPPPQPFCLEKVANICQKLNSRRFILFCNRVRPSQCVCSRIYLSAQEGPGEFPGSCQWAWMESGELEETSENMRGQNPFLKN